MCRSKPHNPLGLKPWWLHTLATLASLVACASEETPPGPNDGGEGGTGGTATTSTTSGGAPMGAGGAGGQAVEPTCAVTPGDLDARPFCTEKGDESDGLQLVTKWQYAAPLWHAGDSVHFRGEPLVANLTDDNQDGRIDLCDVPDVIVHERHFDLTLPEPLPDEVVLVVLSGSDGEVMATLDPGGIADTFAAIADLDRNGTPEIITTNRAGHVIALDPTGNVLWESSAEVFDPIGWYELDPPEENYLRAIFVAESAVAVHDLDGDGSPEILVGMSVLDADGNLLFEDPTRGAEFGPIVEGRTAVRPTAADLDGDGVLEVLFGHVAYTASGDELWRVPSITPGYAHPADFDGDGETEVLITSEEGLTLVAASGDVLWGPTWMDEGEPPRHWCWGHPAAIADVDEDELPEAIVNTCEKRMVLRIDSQGPTVLRSEPVPISTDFGADTDGSTAFGFRGEAADWVAYHYRALQVFAGIEAPPIAELDRTFARGGLYPVVADADNDGSADVLTFEGPSPRLVVYEDSQKRPSPARRIWNQWAYGATLVREDAIIPTDVSTQRTFRAQGRVSCRVAGPPK